MKVIDGVLVVAAVAGTLSPLLHAAESVPRSAASIAQQLCTGCHGPNLAGGSAASLIDPATHGATALKSARAYVTVFLRSAGAGYGASIRGGTTAMIR